MKYKRKILATGGIVLLAILISVGWTRWFTGPSFNDVHAFLLRQKEDAGWIREFGSGPPGYIRLDWTDEIRYLRQGSDSFYVFYTPHYMLFAEVTHTNGRVKSIFFHGPNASKAVSEIENDLKSEFPGLRYIVVDGP